MLLLVPIACSIFEIGTIGIQNGTTGSIGTEIDRRWDHISASLFGDGKIYSQQCRSVTGESLLNVHLYEGVFSFRAGLIDRARLNNDKHDG